MDDVIKTKGAMTSFSPIRASETSGDPDLCTVFSLLSPYQAHSSHMSTHGLTDGSFLPRRYYSLKSWHFQTFSGKLAFGMGFSCFWALVNWKPRAPKSSSFRRSGFYRVLPSPPNVNKNVRKSRRNWSWLRGRLGRRRQQLSRGKPHQRPAGYTGF